jgi:hypothetical protein
MVCDSHSFKQQPIRHFTSQVDGDVFDGLFGDTSRRQPESLLPIKLGISAVVPLGSDGRIVPASLV